MAKKTILPMEDLDGYGWWTTRMMCHYLNYDEPDSIVPKIFIRLIIFLNSSKKHLGLDSGVIRDEIKRLKAERLGDNEELIPLLKMVRKFIKSVKKEMSKKGVYKEEKDLGDLLRAANYGTRGEGGDCCEITLTFF